MAFYTNFFNRLRGGGPSPKTASVSGTTTGPVYTVARLLGSSSALSLIAGTNGNLSMDATSGVITAASAIGGGNDQVAVVRESSGLLAVEYGVTIKGTNPVVTPTPTPTPAPTPSPTPTPSGSAPDAPTISIVPGNAFNTINITDAVNTGGAAITGHKVYRGSVSGGQTLVATYPISSGLVYQDTQLTNNAAYYYQFTTLNAAGFESARSNEVSGTPSAGNGLTANQQMLAALPPRPLVGELGGSRQRQNGATAGTQTRSLPSGQLVWGEYLDPRLFHTEFAYSAGVNSNSNFLTGMLFANDGNGAWDQFQRIPAILASDVDVVVVAMSSNTVQYNDYDIYHNDLGRSLTAANYVSLHQQICLALINGGKPVIFNELWERGVYLHPARGAAIASITFSGTTATVTTTANHGLQSSGSPDAVSITGASSDEYNVVRKPVTVVSSTVFTYQMASAPSADATVVGSFVYHRQVGGVWQSGSQPRTQIPLINAAMKTWCQQQGIPFIEQRTALTIQQQNGNNIDTIPNPDYVRSDATHHSTKGGKATGEIYNAVFKTIFTRAPEFDETAAGNLINNPTFTGTGGNVSVLAAGSVAPDGVTFSRTGSTATITAAKIVANGRTGIEVSIDRSSMTSSTAQEGFAFTVATSAPAAPGYHSGRIRTSLDAGDAWYGTTSLNGVGNSWGMIAMDNGGSGVTDPTGSMEMFDGIATGGMLKSMPASITAAPGFSVRSPSWRKGDGSVLKIRFFAPEVRPAYDPNLLMYNEASAVVPALSSSATLTVPEEQTFSTIVTTTIPARLSLSGADASKFTLKKTGLLSMIATPDFETPADAGANNVYDINVVMTPFNPTQSVVTTPVTVAINDVADGSVYRFTGTDGDDVAALYPGVTTSAAYVAGAIYVSGNTAKNRSSGSGGYVFFPAEATNGNTEVRVEHTSGVSTGPGILIRIDPVTLDRVTMGWNTSQVMISRTKGGVNQPSVNLSTYTNPSSTTSGSRGFIYQIINNVLRVYQNGVELTSAAGIDCTGCADTSNVSGISASASSSNNGNIDTLNIRPAMPRVGRVVLKTLTVTSSALESGIQYAGVINNYTGTPSMVVSSDPSGMFYVDGFNLRTTDALGASGTVYTIVISEDNDNAVASPKTSTITITVP